MKFWKVLVICLILSLPFIYGFSSYKKGTFIISQKVTAMGQLPSQVTESSGLEQADENGTFFTHNDHGAQAVLYKVNEAGKLVKSYAVAGAGSEDWEDLTRDTNGNLYIANTGNNSGQRTDLEIYKVSIKNPTQAQTISFTYGDKPDEAVSSAGKKGKGKAKKRAVSYDCEAIFWNNGKLYLVTKDRSKTGTARLYTLPDSPGNHTATLVTTKALPEQITSVDLSPSGNKLALMSLGKLHVFNVSGNNFLNGSPQTIDLGNVGQTEGLVFTDDKTVVFTNEAGQIFKYSF